MKLGSVEHLVDCHGLGGSSLSLPIDKGDIQIFGSFGIRHQEPVTIFLKGEIQLNPLKQDLYLSLRMLGLDGGSSLQEA